MNAKLVEEFRGIPVFSSLSDEELAWLAEHSEERSMKPGQVVTHEGDPADVMMIVLEGEMQGRRESLGADAPVFTITAGAVTGMLPYSRMTTFSVTIRAMVPTRVANIHINHFPEMLQSIPSLGPKLVGVLADRVREVTKLDQQRDKLAALGKLSAGLAHELNNPAAAGKRAASALRETLADLRNAEAELDRISLTARQREQLRAAEDAGIERQAQPRSKDALQLSDMEDRIGNWLQQQQVEKAWELAPIFAEADVDVASLDAFAGSLPAEALAPAIRRVAARLDIARLALEIQNSTGRISELVQAIKEYSFMDRAPVQEVDVAKGLESTLTILSHKLKHGIKVVREYDPQLPKIFSYGSELNQVWTNLIDNAIDAMHGSGLLRIRTCREDDSIMVEIVDNGAGIPKEIQSRIFDPFFTTKAVGDGSGLGLDTVYRIVRQHHGNISFASSPGNTCFRVRLPIKQVVPPQEEVAAEERPSR